MHCFKLLFLRRFVLQALGVETLVKGCLGLWSYGKKSLQLSLVSVLLHCGCGFRFGLLQGFRFRKPKVEPLSSLLNLGPNSAPCLISVAPLSMSLVSRRSQKSVKDEPRVESSGALGTCSASTPTIEALYKYLYYFGGLLIAL